MARLSCLCALNHTADLALGPSPPSANLRRTQRREETPVKGSPTVITSRLRVALERTALCAEADSTLHCLGVAGAHGTRRCRGGDTTAGQLGIFMHDAGVEATGAATHAAFVQT